MTFTQPLRSLAKLFLVAGNKRSWPFVRRSSPLFWQGCPLRGSDFVLEPRCVLAAIGWNGGGLTNNCSEAANWAGGVAPGANDTMVFDSAVSNKDAIIDANFAGSVLGFEIKNDYRGNITVTKNFTATS